MSDILQKQFYKFHSNIKLNDIEHNKALRDKRDMLVNEIREYLKKKSEDEGTKRITFAFENQGSYSMGTGIEPLEGDDYDIDLMLLFNIDKDDFNPVEIKRLVYKALDKQFRTVEYKTPCVRVQYHKKGEESYHVDMACYADDNDYEETYLSRGKPETPTHEREWEISEPKELKKKINGKYSDVEEKKQFKRVIRYLKRWKDYKFSNTVNGKPTGIAITALAYNGFEPFTKDSFNDEKQINDLEATRKLVNYILDEFSLWTGKIKVKLPVEPYNNLFEKMTSTQMGIFKNKLTDLSNGLLKAKNETDPHEATKILNKLFGDDFEIIEKQATGQRRKRAFVGSTEQA